MLCPSCGADLPDDSYYCAECGAQIDEKAFNAQYAAPAASGSSSGHYPDSYDSEPLSLADSLFRPFKDPEWFIKVLIAAAFGLVPFFGQLAGMILILGVQVEYIRKILNRNQPEILPKWDNWQDLLVSGIMLWLVQAVYVLGVYFISGIAFIPFIGAIMAMWEQLQNATPENAFAIVFGTLSIPILITSLIVTIFATFAFLIPIFYARNKNFGDAFQLGAMFRMIMADLTNFIIITLALFGISLGLGLTVGGFLFVAALVLSFIPIIGQIIVYFISGLISLALMYITMMMTASALTEFYIKNRHIAET